MLTNRTPGFVSYGAPNGLLSESTCRTTGTGRTGAPALADAVEDLRVARADDHLVAAGQPAQEAAFGVRRPGGREARRPVVLVGLEEARAVVGPAGEVELDDRAPGSRDALPHPLAARLLNQPAHADVRRDLHPVDLVRRRVDTVADAGRQRQVVPHAPAVLHVELVLVRRVLARDGLPTGIGLPSGHSWRVRFACDSTPRRFSQASAYPARKPSATAGYSVQPGVVQFGPPGRKFWPTPPTHEALIDRAQVRPGIPRASESASTAGSCPP
jgi:hypothetical protein